MRDGSMKKWLSAAGAALLTLLMAVSPVRAEGISGSEQTAVQAEQNSMPELIPGEKGTLQVTLTCIGEDNQDVPLAEVKLGIYQVAELAVRGGSAEYTLTEPFADMEISFAGMTASDSNEAAAQLAVRVLENSVDGILQQTDSRGNALFENLEPGIYLVKQENYQAEETQYLEMAPYLAMVPGIQQDGEENAWNYSVITVPKVSIQEKEELETGSIEVTKRVTKKTADGMQEITMADVTFYVGLFTDPEGTHLYDNACLRPVHLNNGLAATIVFENLPYGIYYVFETDVAGKPLPTDVAIESGELIYMCLMEGDGTQKAVLNADSPEVQKVINNCYLNLPQDEYRDPETEEQSEYESEESETSGTESEPESEKNETPGTESEPEESETPGMESEPQSEESETSETESGVILLGSVKTGDDTNLVWYLTLLCLSAAVLLLGSKRKRM